jgi:hypothetical protein
MTQISTTTPPGIGGLTTNTSSARPETTTSAETLTASLPAVDPVAQFGATHGLHPSAQQFAYADKNGAGGAAGATQAKGAPIRARTTDELKQLARDPTSAHQAWKSLNATERSTVLNEMEQRYGKDFAEKFADAAKSGETDFSVSTWQPGTGPSKERLLEQGYRLAGKEHTGNAAWDVDVWVHPSGKTVRMDVSTYKFKPSEEKPTETTTGTPTPPVKEGPAAKMPPFIDPHADRTRLFGDVIAVKEDVDAAFGKGDMVMYKSGALELFLDDQGGKSYVFVPIKDRPGQYAVYGPDGHRLNDKAWQIPPSDIPDPNVDAVD